jgi:hypothetical protein
MPWPLKILLAFRRIQGSVIRSAPLMENLPDQTAEAVSNRPDRFLVTEMRQPAPEEELKTAAPGGSGQPLFLPRPRPMKSFSLPIPRASMFEATF